MMGLKVLLTISIILVLLSLFYIVVIMFGYKVHYRFKIKHKAFLIPFFCLLITVIVLVYLRLNTSLDHIVQASMNYYSCLDQRGKDIFCEKYKNKLMAEISAVELTNVEKKNIDKAVDLGRYKVKAGEGN